MKAYWDASALFETYLDQKLHDRLRKDGGFTRTHSLSEVFSSMTGGRHVVRVDADQASQAIEEMVQHLEFVDLTAKEITQGLQRARQLGVRGGRVHDYVHALAAEKSGAKKLLTLDRNDFSGLLARVSVEQV